MNGNKDATEYLLQKGASHESRSCCGQTPLHLAAAGGHLGTARTLLQHLASPDVLDSRRWTPLHWAVFGGWGDVAELLLDNGAELEGPSGVGTSPLQLAVMVGNEAAVRLLLHRGADANLRGSNGRTALHLCACSAEKKVISGLGLENEIMSPSLVSWSDASQFCLLKRIHSSRVVTTFLQACLFSKTDRCLQLAVRMWPCLESCDIIYIYNIIQK